MSDTDIKQTYDDAFQRSEDTYGKIKQCFIEDTKFRDGDQWPDSAKQGRETVINPRPCLVINKAAPLVANVVNNAKQQKFEIICKPVDDDADPEVAKIYGGMIRNIEYNSRATEAYMWALECAVAGGFGYFRLDNEYLNDASFDQTIRINKILNPISVCWDADSDAIDGRDAKVVALYDYVSEERANRALFNLGTTVNKKDKLWVKGKNVKVGEVFWVDDKPDELIQLADGSKIKKSETDKAMLKMLEIGGQVARRRSCHTRVVRWAYLVNGEVIEQTEINSKYIPVVPVYGRRSYVNGKLDMRGLIRDSKDACRMYNYMSSLIVEQIALAPRVPYIGAEGQFDGHPEWNDANNSNYAYLEYKPVTLGGQMAPPPQRNNGPSSDPSVERYLMIAADDIKATSGIYDASVGRQSNETSGRAINARAAQGALSTFDFIDNLSYSIEQGGRICVDMLPRITSPETVVRIMGDSSKEQRVVIGKEFQDADTGKMKRYDLDRGQYDVEVDVGTGDRTRRERALELITPVMNNPENARLLMDVYAANLDIKDAEKIAKRFKSLLPPAVLAAENDDEDKETSPEVEALQQHAEGVITELKGQLDQLNAAFEQAKAAAAGKDADIALKNRELDIKQQEVDIKAKDSKVDNAMKVGGAVTDGMAEEHVALAREVEHLSKEMDMVTAALEKLYDAGGPPRPAQQGVADQTSPPNNFETAPGLPQADETMTSGATLGAPEEPPAPSGIGTLE